MSKDEEIAVLKRQLHLRNHMLRNVVKDIRDDVARGGMALSWSGVADTISGFLYGGDEEEINPTGDVERLANHMAVLNIAIDGDQDARNIANDSWASLPGHLQSMVEQAEERFHHQRESEVLYEQT